MFPNSVHHLYSPRASCLLAQTHELPNVHWTEANVEQIVEAEHLAGEARDPESLLPLALSLQVDEKMFPVVDGVKLQKIPYLAYWYWELRPALREIPKVDANDRFCAHFLLSVQDYNHIPMNLAEFLHDLCRAVRKRCHLYVELDDIGVSFDGGFVCGYLQWRGELRSTLEWRDRVSQLWLTDPYGPVYYETNALIVSHDMLKAWHTLVLAAHSNLSIPA